jgi:hypothetical protein
MLKFSVAAFLIAMIAGISLAQGGERRDSRHPYHQQHHQLHHQRHHHHHHAVHQ